jgi:SAM-dependent MidA family methyltransferase
LQIADYGLRIADLVRERGPITVAAFMDLALYDREVGYYARAAQRSGRAGDFFTSVDVGPLFGELIAIQLAEMADILTGDFDLVEAGAGNGRLSADILRAARAHFPSFYDRIRLHLVETSAAARGEQRATLGEVGGRLDSSAATLPESFEGALVANELLDAMPVHQVVMREEGLREVYVNASSPFSAGADHTACLVTVEGPPSTPALAAYLDRLGIALEPGWRVEINLRAVDWIRDAARRLGRGFIVLIDYGHDARELYSAAHADGTLTTFTRHTSAGPESAGAVPTWLRHPGEQDITAHVDFTSVRAAAEAEGCATLGFLDQTYFLMGLLTGGREPFAVSAMHMAETAKGSRHLKTLIMPGGLGSTHKVLILGKGVGAPALHGCSFRMRVT